jgi:hypothetical protein
MKTVGMKKNKNPAERVFTASVLAGLGAIWCMVAAVQFIWLRQCAHPPWGDGIIFMLRGMKYAAILRSEGLLNLLKVIYVHSEGIFVSFLDLIYTIYYVLCGVTSARELMIPPLFVGLGMLGVYGVSARFFSKGSGFVAVVIFCSMIDVIVFGRFGGFREYYMMCFIPWTWFLLESSVGFNDRRYSVWAGIFIGLTVAIKYEALMWLCMPVIFAICFHDRQAGVARRERRDRLVNLFLCAGVALLVSGIWYWPQYQRLFAVLTARTGRGNAEQLGISLEQPFFYINAIVQEMMSSSLLAFMGLLIICTVGRLKIKPEPKAWRQLAYAFVYMMSPLLLFSIMTCQYRVHILPFLAFASVFMAGFYYLIRPAMARYVVLVLLVLHVLGIQYEAATYVYPRYQGTNYFTKLSILDRLGAMLESKSFGRVFGGLKDYDVGQGWNAQIKYILRSIADDAVSTKLEKSEQETVNILVLANRVPARYHQFRYFTAKLELPFTFIKVLYEQAFWRDMMKDEILFDPKVDYIITEDFDADWENNGGENYGIAQIKTYIKNNQDEFNKIYESFKLITTSRASMIKIYRRKFAHDNNIVQ